MASKRNGVVIGIVAVAVIGVVAITFYSTRGRVADEDAAGAIGAAERYRAQQISDEDVILDIPGQEELAAAIFEVCTDEQKAELLGRMDEAGRHALYAHFNEADAFARMSPEQQAHFVLALRTEAQERVANALSFKAEDLSRMNIDALGRAVANMDAEARARAVGRFDADDAFARMSPEQQAHFVLALRAEAQERFANALSFKAADLSRMNIDALGRAVANMDAEARARAVGRYEANEEVFERMNNMQRAAFADALGAKAFERAILQARAFNNLRQEQQLAVWSNLGRNGQEAALRYAGLSADLARGNALERQMQFDRFTSERHAAQEAATR